MKNYQRFTACALYICSMMFGAMVVGGADNLSIAIVWVINTFFFWVTIGGFEIGKDSE